MDKRGAANNVWMFVIIGLIAAYLLMPNFQTAVQGLFQGTAGSGSSGGNTNTQNLVPSDLKTTITLNTKDGLATTATNANVSYYVFKKDGSYLKEGTTSAGTASFDVQYGGDYEVLAYDDDGTSPDYLPTSVSFTADSGEGSLKTINMDLNREGTFRIEDFQDAIDLDNNLTRGLDSTRDIELIYVSNLSSAANLNPMIVIDANQTSIKDFSFTGFTKVTCPVRLTTTVERMKLCFRSEGISKNSDSVARIAGKVRYSASVAVSSVDFADAQMIDEQMYRNPDYATAGRTAFKIDTENKNDNSNVGAVDTPTIRLYFGA